MRRLILKLVAAVIYAGRSKSGAQAGDKAQWRREAIEEAIALIDQMDRK